MARRLLRSPLMRAAFALLAAALLLPMLAHAQSGKLTGTVVDSTGAPLPGVNILLLQNGESTQQGGQTDAEGRYTILNVRPGTYDVRASFVGFATETHTGVDVNIDQTTTEDFSLRPATQQMEEVVVKAGERVVRPDVASNTVDMDEESFENVPVIGLEGLIGMQAGADGLEVRGSDARELTINMDGATMRGGRTGEPFTGVSYTSISEVQVQTGGFSAENGNVRSGLVNVVTKEGPRNRYSFDVITRYSPAQNDYYGMRPDDPDSYFLRTFNTPRIAYEGVFAGCESPQDPPKNDQGCVWDSVERGQAYMGNQWIGFNEYSKLLLTDGFEGNDYTPQELKQIFDRYTTSRNLSATKPDYTADVGFGGPVPGASDALGDLRFWASYRQTSDAYPLPMSAASDNLSRTGRLKLTTDLASNMKLQLSGMYNRENGMNTSFSGFSGIWDGHPDFLQYNLQYRQSAIFSGVGLDYVPQRINRAMFGGRFTHALSRNTFYELSAYRSTRDYLNSRVPFADETTVGYIGSMNLKADEIGKLQAFRAIPFAHNKGQQVGLFSNLGRFQSQAVDSSRSTSWNGSFKMTSQLNEHFQVKGGVDYIHDNLNVDHGQYSQVLGELNWEPNDTYEYDRSFQRAGAYLETQLSYEGLIANVGVRADYFDPIGDWYTYGPFTSAFNNANGKRLDEVLEQDPVESQLRLSPRLGVSFPVTNTSKLFFNYGYFRQVPDGRSAYQVRNTALGAVTQIGNPRHEMPTTISYELGYGQNLFDMFLVQLTGYYKAAENQPRYVYFENIGGDVSYGKDYPLNYGDTRGLELSVRKLTGRWVRGFVNLTYASDKSGDFGLGSFFENPAQQREFRRTALEEVNTPDPQLEATLNLQLVAPQDFGPKVGTLSPLGDWRLGFLGGWEAGENYTWDGGGGSGETEVLQDNVRYKGDWDMDLRITKNVDVGGLGRFQLFADVRNVFGFKRLHPRLAQYSRDYMRSLHLPRSTFEDLEGGAPYEYVFGNDQPGDYRPEDVEYVPIEVTGVGEDGLPNISTETALQRSLYYARPDQGAEGTYYSWTGSEWEEANQGRVDQVLDDKAYINMPGNSSFRFLYPRRVNLGLRITF